jgi:protein phosphatase
MTREKVIEGAACESAPPFAVEAAALSDVGTERENNEDSCATLADGATRVVVAVADGVSSYEAGETASRKAVEATLRSFAEQAAHVPAGKRLVRAVQQANIDVYDMAIVVPELRGMATTLTAVAIDRGELTAAHVGDSRLYLVRDGKPIQLSKDHTVAAERMRMGLLSEKKAREHPDRSTLTRSLGRELIVAADRIITTVAQGDVVIVCSDGLYNVLGDDEMVAVVGDLGPEAACRALIDTANARGTIDNLTAAVVRVTGATPRVEPVGLGARFRRLLGRGP